MAGRTRGSSREPDAGHWSGRRAGRARWGAVVGAAVVGAAAVAPAGTLAADPVNVAFAATGFEQQWVVPDGITSITVVAIGAPGGAGSGGAAGGIGARVEGTLSVTPGTTLYVEVGAAGFTGTVSTGGLGGFNGGAAGGGSGAGGGGGGGASDLRTISRTVDGTLDSRLLVAAGGGGGGGSPLGGAGGIAGGNGANSLGGGASQGGFAGTASAGGNGGFLGVGGLSGINGVLGTGGAGAPGPGQTGGGGGGGLYGGGGGGSSTSAGGGGGGGGSSSSGSATNASIGPAATTVPSITITYTPAGGGGGGNDSGVVDAVITVPSSAACLELSTTTIDFGTAPLGATGVEATPDVLVTNCSGAPGSLFARGSDASGTGAAWTLDDTAAACGDVLPLGVDRYHLYVGETSLSDQNKSVAQLGAGAETSLSHFIDTACPGSTGAGTTMSLQVTYLITE